MATRRRERSFEDVRGAAERMLKALARRTGEADEFELGELVAMREVLEEAIVEAIDRQRAYGKSWQSIADSLGIKRQSAQERYGKRSVA